MQTRLLDNKQHSDESTNLERIVTISSDVNDIAELSQSMNILVHQQGDMVDNIEHNITMSHGHVIIGTQHLKKAEAYSKNPCALWFILALIFILIGLSIAVGVKFHSKY